MSKIAPPDRHSTDFQTRLERHFTPGRLGDRLRQVWKSALPKTELRATRHGYFAHVQKWGESGLTIPPGALSRRAPALCRLFPFIAYPLGLFVRLCLLISMGQNAYEPPPPMYTVVAPLLLSNTSKLRRKLSLETPSVKMSS